MLTQEQFDACRAAASDPKSPSELLLSLVEICPREVLDNPALNSIKSEDEAKWKLIVSRCESSIDFRRHAVHYVSLENPDSWAIAYALKTGQEP